MDPQLIFEPPHFCNGFVDRDHLCVSRIIVCWFLIFIINRIDENKKGVHGFPMFFVKSRKKGKVVTSKEGFICWFGRKSKTELVLEYDPMKASEGLEG